MKKLAKHESLRNLVRRHDWGFVGTNEYDDIKKAHLLSMRSTKRPLVNYMAPNKKWPDTIKFFADNRGGEDPFGKDWDNNFYGVTAYGVIALRELFPDMRKQTDEMLGDLFYMLFHNDQEFYFRVPYIKE